MVLADDNFASIVAGVVELTKLVQRRPALA
jgi:hypothetical protein